MSGVAQVVVVVVTRFPPFSGLGLGLGLGWYRGGVGGASPPPLQLFVVLVRFR